MWILKLLKWTIKIAMRIFASLILLFVSIFVSVFIFWAAGGAYVGELNHDQVASIYLSEQCDFVDDCVEDVVQKDYRHDVFPLDFTGLIYQQNGLIAAPYNGEYYALYRTNRLFDSVPLSTIILFLVPITLIMGLGTMFRVLFGIESSKTASPWFLLWLFDW
jgi:hypothetical protein